MYFTPGTSPNELGDFEVVQKDGQLHAFYLSLPSHDAVGHLVSDDGINWTPLPAAVRTGEPDDYDGDQIWTMGVFEKDGVWFMLYTALTQRGKMQRTALATSRDLVHWEKYPDNPVISADPRWYEAEQRGNFRVDWRDPHVINVDGKLHGFICARRNEGLLNRRGCAGYFTSDDGYHWDVHPPACTPSSCFDWECPSVFGMNGRYYMVAIAGGCRRMAYRVADCVEGPYRRPSDDSLLPGSNMSVRPCLWNGKMHLFHWQRGERDWGSSPGYAAMASPKLAKVSEDGSLTVESFDWSPLCSGSAADVNARTPAVTSCGEWQWSDERLAAEGRDGPAIWLMETPCKDFILRADLELDGQDPACEFGLVIRADEPGDRGIFAGIVPGRFAVELVKYIHNRRQGPESLWRGRSVEQSYHVAPAADGKYSLYAIAFGPSLEFNVNGRLSLAHCTMPRREGRVGLFLEDGKAAFSNISVQPLSEPKCHWEW